MQEEKGVIYKLEVIDRHRFGNTKVLIASLHSVRVLF